MAIEKLGKNKYKIIVPISYNGNKRERHIETWNGTKTEAKSREEEIKLSLRNNTYIRKNKITVKQLIEEWLANSKEIWSPKTYVSYKNYCKNIIKSIGHINLQNLNVKILEDFYKELRTKTTYSDKSIRHHYTIISTALNKAVIWGYILSNPNTRIEKPKVKKKNIECYSLEETERLLEALKNEPLKYQMIIRLALDSGCRRSELTGLTWEDIDFNNASININKTTQYVKEKGIFEKSTKSDTSNRIVYITKGTLELLKKYKKEQLEKRLKLGSKWQNSKRVFTTEEGADMFPDTPSDIFEKIIKKHNLKKIKFHALRHTSISLQIKRGIQPQIITNRAGHSNVTVTHSIYSHFFDSELKDVAEKMEDILRVK